MCTTFACCVHYCTLCTVLCSALYTTLLCWVHYCGILCSVHIVVNCVHYCDVLFALLCCAMCTPVHHALLPPQLWHITTGYCTPLSCASKDSTTARWCGVRAALVCSVLRTVPPQVWHITSNPTQSWHHVAKEGASFADQSSLSSSKSIYFRLKKMLRNATIKDWDLRIRCEIVIYLDQIGWTGVMGRDGINMTISNK